MPKGRFTALDLRRALRDMQGKVVGFRIANIYDVNGRTYLFKLAQPGAIDVDKLFIVIESGVRIHTTRFSRDRREVPSVFTMKLRKAIKTKRLESIRQLGYDRVVDLKFGQGDLEAHLIVEFYAAGNIIVTDKDYKIQALLRPYKLEDGTAVAVNERYPVEKFAEISHVTEEQLTQIVSAPDAAKTALKELFLKSLSLGADVIEHCLVDAGIDPKTKAGQFDLSKIPALTKSMQTMANWIDSNEPSPAYIVTRPAGAAAPNKDNTPTSPDASEGRVKASAGDAVLYESFQPMRLQQTASAPVVEFADFDIAVDEYFSKIESQKVEAQRLEHEQTVHKRLGKVREDQERRVKDLESQEQKLERQANIIEQNVALVDAAINAVNRYLASQIPWDKLQELVKQEQKKGDPIASVIHKMKLAQNKITLLLFDNLMLDEEDMMEEAEQIEVDLTMTAHSNATEYYARRKKAAEKRQKTEESAKMALKSAERKALSQLKDVKTKASIQKLRKPYWFEKFNWFLSSDGYIVVSGRDMQQNELLYKRYLHKGDAYIHADIHGASTVIVKNPLGGEIAPRTLAEAGTFSICYSKAWKSKIVTSAWWVHDDQVSKTAPSGEFLTTGSFMIRGKKNFLPPSTLVMGLGILFRLADECVPGHVAGDGEEPNSDEEDNAVLSTAEKKEAEQTATNSEESTVTEGAAEEKAESEDEADAVVTEEAPESPDVEQEQTANDEPTKEGETAETKEIEESDEEESDEEEDDLVPIPTGDYQVDLAKDHAATSSSSNPESAASQSSESSNKASDRKRKLSKKERQALKSGGNKPQQQQQQQQQQPGKQKGPAPEKVPRGKKGKLKKMKTKYADQDEEERQAMMEMLKSSGNKAQEQKEAPKPAAKSPEESAEEFKRKQRQRQEMEAKRVAKLKEEEEIRNLLREEKLDMLSEEDRIKIQQTTAKGLGVNLAALTSRPKPEDIIMFAIPVCAPYEALRDYKYKVKITPGTLKKGKAAQLATSVFLKLPDATQVEKELIKAIPDGEMTAALIPNVKLSTPGLASILQQKGKGKAKEAADIEITE